MIRFLKWAALAAGAAGFLNAAHATEDECSAKCNGGDVKVDLQAHCMCLDGEDGDDKCFKINIGSDGPRMTTQGLGKLGEAKGAKYQTKNYSSRSYDNDAIAMGIPNNDAVGKWIHKTSECGPGGNNATQGCIAVPCEFWPDVKDMMGKELAVCGGGSGGGSSGSGAGGSSGSRRGGHQ